MISDLVSQEDPAIDAYIWEKYGDYLEGLNGRAYREHVLAYVAKEDSPRPMSYQLELLKKVGFKKTDILHKNLCFGAFGAVK